jgi:alpha-N-arabinofuranosidase
VPYLDIAGTVSPEDGKISIFILNRDLSKPHAVEINWQDRAPSQVLAAFILTGDDLKASNSFRAPKRVSPQPMDKPALAGGRLKLEVPARSHTVLQLGA